MNFGEISRKYVTTYAAFEEQYQKIQRRIEIREKQLERLKVKAQKISYHERPGWIDSLVKPIAEAMLPFLPDRYFKILGPFGLGCQTAIHFYKNGSNDAVGNGNCISITFEPGTLREGDLFVVDYLVNTGEFSPNSIGAINGMNNPKIPVPDYADAQWFVDFMNHQEAESRKQWEEKQAKAETA